MKKGTKIGPGKMKKGTKIALGVLSLLVIIGLIVLAVHLSSGDSPKGCTSARDCAGSTPVCKQGKCEKCTANTQCPVSQPVCSSSGACVEDDSQLPVPNAPTAPQGAGEFGGKWARVANTEPWCVPTQYRARYVKTDDPQITSAWSSWSATFQSDEYTHPSLSVSPVNGYAVEWEITALGEEFLNIPVIQPIVWLWYVSETRAGDHFYIKTNFNYTQPGPVPLDDFIKQFNENRTDGTSVLSRGPNGHMKLTQFNYPSSVPVYYSLQRPQQLPMLHSLGFDETQFETRKDIIAPHLPVVSGRPAITRRVMGSSALVDTTNPCSKVVSAARGKNFIKRRGNY